MRGGARPGAGRKPAKPGEERKVRGFRLTEHEWELMKSVHKSIINRTSISVIFDDAHTDGTIGKISENMRAITENEAKVVQVQKVEKMNALQKFAYDEMRKGKNIFITGGAGTGKSYVLRRFIESIKNKKNVLVCAPTGIAARNIGGVTAHRAFRIPIGIITPGMRDEFANPETYKSHLGKAAKTIAAADVLIIDEVSMMRSDVIDYIMQIISDEALPHDVYNEQTEQMETVTHNIQIIVCGDFAQLPPVISERERSAWDKTYPDNPKGFAFLSSAWHFKMINLTEVIRQSDRDFSQALNEIRLGDENGLTFINKNRQTQRIKDAIDLCATNKEAERINAKALNALPGTLRTYLIDIEGDVKSSDINLPRELALKAGCRVILSGNDQEKGYYNGQFATVTQLNTDSIKVRLDGSESEVEIERKTISIEGYTEKEDKKTKKKKLEKVEVGHFSQIPVKLGYAITVHRSQGQTYDAVNLHVGHFFASGQLYVALSRCKSINRTYFYKPVPADDLFVDEEVKNFYKV